MMRHFHADTYVSAREILLLFLVFFDTVSFAPVELKLNHLNRAEQDAMEVTWKLAMKAQGKTQEIAAHVTQADRSHLSTKL